MLKNIYKNEIKYLNEMQNDSLLEITDEGIFLTEIGRDFTQNIMNVFDKYDLTKSYKERLETVKKTPEPLFKKK